MPLRDLSFRADDVSTSRAGYGISVAGEWSNGFNDCGLFLNGVTGVPTYGGNCADWQDSSQWDDSTRAGLLQLALASMEALDSWFYWTWKVSLMGLEPSTTF